MDTITSPIGTAIWPKLITPEAFQGEGDRNYETKLKLNMKDEDTIKFLHELEEAHASGKELLNQWRASRNEKPLTASQLKKEANLPWQAEEDDDGNETGYVLVKCKLKEFRKMKGQQVAQRPALWDSSNQPWDVDTPIWSGSEMAVAVEPFPWFVPAMGYGISLRLKGVQVHKVVNSENTSASAEDFGFKASKSDAAESASSETLGESAFDADDF